MLARRPGKQHLNRKLTRQHIRKLGKWNEVDDADMSHIKKNLPYAKGL